MNTAERITLAVSVGLRHIALGMSHNLARYWATVNLTPYERECVLAKLPR